MSTKQTATFYNNLAEFYRYIFEDWHKSIAQQGKNLDRILEAHGFLPSKHTLYDCTCGIGTQTFALALQGWQIHATDLSETAIAKAKDYASEFDTIFTPTFDVMDLLQSPENPPQYDVVIAMDNAVPHFMNDTDLLTALTTMRNHIKDNGLLMMSIRDYDAMRENPPRTTSPSVTEDDEGRRIVFQVWDWADDLSSYNLNLYVVHHHGDVITTQSFPSTYRALRRETLTNALEQIGLQDVQWFMPEETGNYIPIVTARKK